MKSILSIAAMSVLLAFGATVNAEEGPVTQVVAKASSFSLLQGIPADPLTPQAMEAIQGKNHVIFPFEAQLPTLQDLFSGDGNMLRGTPTMGLTIVVDSRDLMVSTLPALP